MNKKVVIVRAEAESIKHARRGSKRKGIDVWLEDDKFCKMVRKFAELGIREKGL